MMARESKAQQETVERVMHEFKEGDLRTGAGDTVTSRRQAVAIGLSEAGASNRQTRSQNEKRLRKIKGDERGDGPTRAELYEQAKEKDVPGRSKMNKAQLDKAVNR